MKRREPNPDLEFEVLPPERAVAQDELSRILAWVLDDLFRVPGTKFRFGLDPVVGLIPGLGDSSTAVFSSVILLQSMRAGVPRIVLARMALNILINSVLGAAPGVGDVFSAWFKSNRRNFALLQKHAGSARTSTRGDWIFVVSLMIGVVTCGIALSIGVVLLLLRVFGMLLGG